MSNINFSGTGANKFDDFIAQFRLIAAINQWPESSLALILGAYLQGPALAYFKCIYKENLDFKSICDLLSEEFPASVDYVEQFYNARQEPNEDILAYFHTLNNLASKANINDEKVFIKKFLKGITNDYKFKLGTKLYSSKAELKATLNQIQEIFEETRAEGMNIPITPPKGILTKVRIDHPFPIDNQRSPEGRRLLSPAPTPSSGPSPRSFPVPREEESYHTPSHGHNLRPRPRFRYTENYRTPFASPSARNHPNEQGHRR